jgi:hypothetical protein
VQLRTSTRERRKLVRIESDSHILHDLYLHNCILLSAKWSDFYVFTAFHKNEQYSSFMFVNLVQQSKDATTARIVDIILHVVITRGACASVAL